MTTRRFNYTECQRIPKRNVVVAIDDDDQGYELSLTYDIADLGLPDNAEVVVEAYADWTVMRFSCGTVGEPSVPKSMSLTEFDSAEGIRCRLKVLGVGQQSGLILAEADAIQPSDASDPSTGRSFVVVRPGDLGSVVWKLTFDEGAPILLLNERLGDWKSFLANAGVRALVLPEVVRQLLREAIERGSDDEETDWPAMCEELAAGLGFGSLPSSDEDDDTEDWVDDVVRKFAQRHRMWRGVLDLFGLEEGA